MRVALQVVAICRHGNTPPPSPRNGRIQKTSGLQIRSRAVTAPHGHRAPTATRRRGSTGLDLEQYTTTTTQLAQI